MQRSKKPRARRKPKATTSDVLGEPTKAPRIKRQWKPYYDRLLALRDDLEKRQSDLTRDAVEELPTFSTHIADAGTDTYDRDFALSMLSSEQDALYQVEQALDRIRNGTYGICELTGKPIEPQRLEAMPWTRFSVEASCRLESEGKVKRAVLGHRQAVPKVDAGQAEREKEHEEEVA